MNRKQQLAKLWVIRGLMQYSGSPLTEKPKRFNRPFHPPAVSVNGSSIEIRLWVSDGGGMRCGVSFSELLFEIGVANGALERESNTTSFFVPCQQPEAAPPSHS